jgi:hypothetical protein
MVAKKFPLAFLCVFYFATCAFKSSAREMTARLLSTRAVDERVQRALRVGQLRRNGLFYNVVQLEFEIALKTVILERL